MAKEYIEIGCLMKARCARRDVNITSVSRRVSIYRKYGKIGFLKRGIEGSFVDPKANKLTAKMEELRSVYKTEQGGSGTEEQDRMADENCGRKGA